MLDINVKPLRLLNVQLLPKQRTSGGGGDSLQILLLPQSVGKGGGGVITQ